MARLLSEPPRRKPLAWNHPGLLFALLGVGMVLIVVTSVPAVLLAWRPGFFLAEVVALLVPAVVYAVLMRAPWEGAFGLRPRVAGGMVLAVVAAVGAWTAGTLLTEWIAQAVRISEAQRQAMQEMAERLFMCHTTSQWVWTILGLSVGAPIAEEVLFRGVFQRGLERRWGRPRLALVLSAFIFAGFHLEAVQFPVLLLLGLLFGWLYQRSGSLWPSIVAHATNNLVAVLVLNKVILSDEAAETYITSAHVFAGAMGGVVVILVLYAVLVGRPRGRGDRPMTVITIPPSSTDGSATL